MTAVEKINVLSMIKSPRLDKQVSLQLPELDCFAMVTGKKLVVFQEYPAMLNWKLFCSVLLGRHVGSVCR